MLLTFSLSVVTCRHFVHDNSTQGKWKLKITCLDCTNINSSRKNKLRIGKNVEKGDYALIGSTIRSFQLKERANQKIQELPAKLVLMFVCFWRDS